MNRKDFVISIGLGSIIMMNPKILFCNNPNNYYTQQMDTNYFEDELVNNAKIFHSSDGEHLEMGGISVTFKVTSEISNNQLGIYEISLSPKTIGAKLHYHRFMDEVFIVNKGTLTVELKDEVHELKSGSMVYVLSLIHI